MEKVWLKNYAPGVPETIDPNDYQSLGELFSKSADLYRNRPAYENLGMILSYDDVDKMSRNFAAYLVGKGLKKGDRIAIMMPNLLQYPIVLLAALRAGLIVVNTNPLYTARELEHQLNDSGAVAIVILENFANTLEAVLDKTAIKTIITTQIGDLAGFPKSLLVNFVVKRLKKMVPAFSLPNTAVKFNDVLAKGKDLAFNDADIHHEDIAFLQYTGGTTGVAKGAALTHRNMIANLLQVEAWISNEINAESQEIFITALPLYHIFSLTANAFSLKLGAKSVLITNPRDMKGFVKELSKHQFTFMAGVNTLFNGLLNTTGFDQLNFSSVKIILGGGMAVQESVANEWKAVTGIPIIEAYGLTETSPGVCVNPTNNHEFSGNIGLPLSSTEVCVKNDKGEQQVFNEPGELCVRGPQVMKEYWNRPKETANVMDAEGWLHTGDIAVINEGGYVKLVDRLKDLIIVSGFNVYPNEVESVVAAHPKVLEVGAIGVANEKSTEVVKIFVVKKDQSLTEKELQDYCHKEMTRYKCPKFITFLDDLPKSNVGKVLRKDLRKLEKGQGS
jgi:long-chain acyl-CoA synthetase